MQNQTATTSEAQRAALAALDQAYEYYAGDVLKPCAKEVYEGTPLAA